MNQLGKLVEIEDLREVWKFEERDFVAFAGLMTDKVFAISMKSKTIKSK